MGLPLNFWSVDDGAFDEEVECVTDHIFGQRESFKSLLIEEVGTIIVAVEIRGG